MAIFCSKDKQNKAKSQDELKRHPFLRKPNTTGRRKTAPQIQEIKTVRLTNFQAGKSTAVWYTPARDGLHQGEITSPRIKASEIDVTPD